MSAAEADAVCERLEHAIACDLNGQRSEWTFTELEARLCQARQARDIIRMREALDG
jgi:hypothetical protein